jgi:hypothetical protein
MQTWMPELYVHSFHLQNTGSGDSYGTGCAHFKSQYDVSFLSQKSVLSAAGQLTALFPIFTPFT